MNGLDPSEEIPLMPDPPHKRQEPPPASWCVTTTSVHWEVHCPTNFVEIPQCLTASVVDIIPVCETVTLDSEDFGEPVCITTSIVQTTPCNSPEQPPVIVPLKTPIVEPPQTPIVEPPQTPLDEPLETPIDETPAPVLLRRQMMTCYTTVYTTSCGEDKVPPGITTWCQTTSAVSFVEQCVTITSAQIPTECQTTYTTQYITSCSDVIIPPITSPSPPSSPTPPLSSSTPPLGLGTGRDVPGLNPGTKGQDVPGPLD